MEELFPNKNNSFYLNTENDPTINLYSSNAKQKNIRKDLSNEKRDNKNLNKNNIVNYQKVFFSSKNEKTHNHNYYETYNFLFK